MVLVLLDDKLVVLLALVVPFPYEGLAVTLDDPDPEEPPEVYVGAMVELGYVVVFQPDV